MILYYEFRCGFGLLMYGFGSKKVLIEDFASTALTEYSVVVINGYLQSINLKQVIYLGALCWYLNLFIDLHIDIARFLNADITLKWFLGLEFKPSIIQWSLCMIHRPPFSLCYANYCNIMIVGGHCFSWNLVGRVENQTKDFFRGFI